MFLFEKPVEIGPRYSVLSERGIIFSTMLVCLKKDT